MGFFDRMLGRNDNNKQGSSATAKDRLQFVLVHDRINIPPEKMREMQEEILAVIKKYVPEIEEDSVAIAVEQTDRYQNKIVAEIPFTKRRAQPATDQDGNDDLADEAPVLADVYPEDETVPNATIQHEDRLPTPIEEPALSDADTKKFEEFITKDTNVMNDPDDD